MTVKRYVPKPFMEFMAKEIEAALKIKPILVFLIK